MPAGTSCGKMANAFGRNDAFPEHFGLPRDPICERHALNREKIEDDPSKVANVFDALLSRNGGVSRKRSGLGLRW
jgi:hypothetical protein